MTQSFSISYDKIKETEAKLKTDIENLENRIEEIYRKALVGDVPVAMIITRQFQPSGSDLKMLSKVFARLSELIPALDELHNRQTAITTITDSKEWLYEHIGDMQSDVDRFLNTFTNDEK